MVLPEFQEKQECRGLGRTQRTAAVWSFAWVHQPSEPWLATEDTEFHRGRGMERAPRRAGPSKAASGLAGSDPGLSGRTSLPVSVVSSFLPWLSRPTLFFQSSCLRGDSWLLEADSYHPPAAAWNRIRVCSSSVRSSGARRCRSAMARPSSAKASARWPDRKASQALARCT